MQEVYNCTQNTLCTHVSLGSKMVQSFIGGSYDHKRLNTTVEELLTKKDARNLYWLSRS